MRNELGEPELVMQAVKDAKGIIDNPKKWLVIICHPFVYYLFYFCYS
jgi:hypothetical protein